MPIAPRQHTRTTCLVWQQTALILFICVQITPIADDGSCDTTIAKEVSQSWINQYKGVCVIKSTIITDYLHEFKKAFNLKIVYNPEFLTESNANEDFKNPIPKYLVASGEIVK